MTNKLLHKMFLLAILTGCQQPDEKGAAIAKPEIAQEKTISGDGSNSWDGKTDMDSKAWSIK